MACQRNSFTITWNVENPVFLWYNPGWNWRQNPIYSRCKPCPARPCELLSPGFIVNAMRETRWKLKLVLHGTEMGTYTGTVLYLVRETEGVGPKEMTFDLEVSFLGRDGSCLKSAKFNASVLSQVAGPQLLEVAHKGFIFQDAWIVRCKMWNIQAQKSEEYIASSRIEVCREICEVKLENFCFQNFNGRRSLKTRSKSHTFIPFFPFYIVIDILSGNIDIVGKKIDEDTRRPCVFRWFLLKSGGNKEKLGTGKMWSSKDKDCSFYLGLPQTKLTDFKELNLPNDVLTMEVEVTLPTGKISSEIKKSECELDSSRNISAMIPNSIDLSTPQHEYMEKKQCDLPSTLKNDLMFLYNDRMFCDTKLRTEAETFPAHKIVLSARSPVFRAMFTTDMKEKISDCVDIKDLSSDTVRRMLLFLYTDTVEDLEWESAQDLYMAADRYGIITLRQRCESYLKKNFCISNVCEILVLADMHPNSDLKKEVQEYILKYEARVFRSDEWKHFTRNYGQLAAETMCLKYR